MPDFLLELGCEEIPARMLDSGAAELGRRVAELLVAERLTEKSEVEIFSTPRRLAVVAHDIRASQPDLEEQVLGPSTKVAFKDSKPTPAAEAFAKKVGLDPSKLKKIETPKGEYLAAQVTRKGRATSEVLAETLPAEILRLYWPKTMYWRDKAPERFVRPVRWLVAMLDGSVIPLELAGVRAGNTSRGHRTLSTGSVDVASPAAYVAALEKAGVVASRPAREQRIRKALDAATRAVSGARWREDAALLSTVVNLTEFPSALLGNFDREFLVLPEEVLVTVMRDHQKYFAVESADGKLAPHFLAVLNTDSDPDGAIRHGHERVLRARFSDARFFWDADQKHPLKERIESLKSVTFQKDLGSYHEKTERVARLANTLAADLANAGFQIDRDAVNEAAWLAKTDLTTELVKEFTELQGIVGGLYARAQGFSPAICDAIYDHYKPESMDEPAPRTVEGAILSIADKADSIAGMFALGLQPTGSKDPFALRRQANGIIKTLAEHRLVVAMTRLFESAGTVYRERGIVHRGTEGQSEGMRDSVDRGLHMPTLPTAEFMQNTLSFMRERLEFYLRDVRGYPYDTVNAVIAVGFDDVVDAVERASAVEIVRKSEDFQRIAGAAKRIRNILRQAHSEGERVTDVAVAESGGAVHVFDARNPGESVYETEPAEKELWQTILQLRPQVEEYRSGKRWEDGLRLVSTLRPHIDRFFDSVMVRVENESVRAVRLGLLTRLHEEFSTIADFSEIVTEGKS